MRDDQLMGRGIHDATVIRAMGEVPRERFVPADQRWQAYDDRALAIGHGQTISQPYMVALMLELLAVRPEH
jgi:protein-L-isoaspartate(D-aspartate) O-methyltransferase